MVLSEAVTQQVWEKATVTEPNDPKLWRKDQCGAWIHRSAHGNRDSQYGWEIDHIQAVSQGGGDEVSAVRCEQLEPLVEPPLVEQLGVVGEERLDLADELRRSGCGRGRQRLGGWAVLAHRRDDS